MKRITVVTPTYNRANKLETAFKSLKNQTIQDFNWLIIDDGSTDNTKDIVTNVFLNDNTDFDIKYIKKENGGKHTALNLAFEIIDTELFIILDSDDYLIENAIEDIINTWEKYKNNDRIAGLVYKRGKDKETSITEKWGDEEETIKNYNDFIINRNIRGDKAEVFRSSIFKNIRFPEYNNEKFVGEGVIWSKIAHEYDMVFCNRILYICKYLEGGLSKSGRELRVNNPKGGMFHAQEYLEKNYNMKIRIKNSILYMVYSRFDGKKLKTVLKENPKNKMILILGYLPSIVLYEKWRKYREGKK